MGDRRWQVEKDTKHPQPAKKLHPGQLLHRGRHLRNGAPDRLHRIPDAARALHPFLEGRQIWGRRFWGGENRLENGPEEDSRPNVEGPLHRQRHGRPGGPGGLEVEDMVKQPRGEGRTNRPRADKESLHSKALGALSLRGDIRDKSTEGLHADIDRRVQHPEGASRHPGGRRIGHGDQGQGTEDRADEKVGATAAEARPGAIAHVADDRLHDQPAQGSRQPEQGNILRICA